MPGTSPVLVCLSSVQGREAQFTACEGFTSHPELVVVSSGAQTGHQRLAPSFPETRQLRGAQGRCPRSG